MIQNSIPSRLDHVMNSRCSDMLSADRYIWNISKIKTMLSTNKIASLLLQSCKAYMFVEFCKTCIAFTL